MNFISQFHVTRTRTRESIRTLWQKIFTNISCTWYESFLESRSNCNEIRLIGIGKIRSTSWANIFLRWLNDDWSNRCEAMVIYSLWFFYSCNWLRMLILCSYWKKLLNEQIRYWFLVANKKMKLRLEINRCTKDMPQRIQRCTTNGRHKYKVPQSIQILSWFKKWWKIFTLNRTVTESTYSQEYISINLTFIYIWIRPKYKTTTPPSVPIFSKKKKKEKIYQTITKNLTKNRKNPTRFDQKKPPAFFTSNGKYFFLPFRIAKRSNSFVTFEQFLSVCIVHDGS